MANKVVNLTIKLKDGVSGVLGKIRGGISKLGTGLKSLGRAFGTIAKAGVVAFGTITTALGATIVAGAKFNVQMARVWTMAGGGIKNFRALREEARALGADFGIAGKEMADGMYGALSAGVKQADLHDFLKIAAKAAVADGSTIATAVNGITTVLDSFGMKTSEAGKMTDLMFQAVAKGKLTFGELARSISQSASVASVMGVKAEEVFAAISQLSKTEAVSTASINLKNMMLSLNKAIGEGWSKTMTLQQALQKVYVDVGGSQLELEKIFGRETIADALKLMGANAEEADRFLKEMGGSVGALDVAHRKVDQFRHWTKLIETAKGALTDFGAKVNDVIGPSVQKVTDKLKEWIATDAITKWAKKAGDAFVGVYDTVVKTIKLIADPTTRDEAIGNVVALLKAGFLDAAAAAGDMLLKIGPKIGDAIGTAAKAAFSPFSKDKLTDEQKSIRKSIASQARKKGGAEGEAIAYDKYTEYAKEQNKIARLDAQGIKAVGKDGNEKSYTQIQKEILAAQIKKQFGDDVDVSLDAMADSIKSETAKFQEQQRLDAIKITAPEPGLSVESLSDGIGRDDPTGAIKGAAGGFAELYKRMTREGLSEYDKAQRLNLIAGEEAKGREAGVSGAGIYAATQAEQGLSNYDVYQNVREYIDAEVKGMAAGISGMGSFASDLLAGGMKTYDVANAVSGTIGAEKTGIDMAGGGLTSPVDKTNELLTKTNEILSDRLGSIR